ncbi:GTPase-activating protein gyp8 [Coemansia javaensis]|uniref:GTPase-activating protein gyp8 n=1 Tax=Coemansia javaensis TaxID=2761396 RepID=A0A9W8HIE0_9FUNG|nr:GTPase-activating protein gyp8 [Coemansia javaensis]
MRSSGGRVRRRRRRRGQGHRQQAGRDPGEAERPARAERIAQAVAAQDLTALRELARAGGLETAQLRRQAWPLLLKVRSVGREEQAAAHRDEAQVALDVQRTRLPGPDAAPGEARARRLEQLAQVVAAVLRSHPWLSYYQGFHELAMPFLCVLGAPGPAAEAARMAALFFVRDAMASGLDHVLAQLRLLYALLEHASPRVHALLAALDVPPFFAISWVLTWFAHDVESLPAVCRIYDVLIASPPMHAVYLAAALVRRREPDVLACDRDFAAVHACLAALPASTADWEPVIRDSCALLARFPAARLQHMARCHLPRLSAVNTYEATWPRLDPERPLRFAALVPVDAGHPLDAIAAEEKPSQTAASAAVRIARTLALDNRWPVAVATLASATMVLYAWLLMQQP